MVLYVVLQEVVRELVFLNVPYLSQEHVRGRQLSQEWKQAIIIVFVCQEA